VVDKERGNFCEVFTPRSGGAQLKGGSSASARSQLDALFKKKPK